MKTRTIRYSAILLIIIIAACTITSSVFAETANRSATGLKESDLPETISLSDALEKGHIARLRGEESDLFDAIFLNENGSKTMYIFSLPIKYVGEDGTLRDKSTKLQRDHNNYYVEDNDVKLKFGSKFAEAIYMEYGGYTLQIQTDFIDKGESKSKLEGNTLVFEKAYINGSTVAYTPLLSGLQQKMIVNEPSELTPFSYNLTAKGLKFSSDDYGNYVFCNDKNDPVFTVGNSTIEGSNGGHYETKPKIRQISDDVYGITVEIDERSVESAGIAYPLVVSTSVNEPIEPVIDDAVIYSGKPNKAYGAYNYNSIGYLDSNYKIGRLLVKCSELYIHEKFTTIDYNDIRRADLHLFTASNGPASYIMPCRMKNSWTEYDVVWSYIDDKSSLMQLLRTGSSWLPKVPTSGGSEFLINITGMVKEWKKSSAYRSKGIMLYNYTSENILYSSYCRDFCSKEYANTHNSDVMPYISVEYDESNSININLQVKYDSAFASRCVAIHGASSTAVNSRLNSLLSNGFTILYNRYGIECSFTTSHYNLYTDDCAAGIDSVCSCVSECFNESSGIYHHTNQEAIEAQITDTSLASNFPIYVVGHKTCSEDEDGSCTGNGKNNGICYHHFSSDETPGKMPYATGKIFVYNGATSSTSTDYKISKTFFHEIGHLYGTPDHYNGTLLQGQNNNCIYGSNRNDEYLQ